MRTSNIFICLLIFMGSLITSCSEGTYVNFDESKPVFERGVTSYHAADTIHQNSIWQKDIDIVEDKIFWTKTDVNIIEAPKVLNQYGILISQHGAYEVFWDGQLIGKNGNPKTPTKVEENGIHTTFLIPKELSTKGEHQLVLKKSIHFYLDYNPYLNFYIADYEKLLKRDMKTNVFIHIFAGVFLMASLYFFFLFLSNPKSYATLIFSVNCLLFFLLILFEFIKTYIDIHYSKHHTRLEIIGIITFLISLLTPLYFSLQFQFPKRKKIVLCYAALLLYIFIREHENHDSTAHNMTLFMWYTSLAIVIFGTLKKMNGAIIVLISFLTSIFFFYMVHYDISIHFGFSIILLGMLYVLSLRTKEQRVAYENSLVHSSRLKIELLKKSIQPHFLMNTLTSLIDWIEEAPEKGVLFIEALAEEFDLINQVENETLIPIAQEIKLCKSHINIMKFRKEIDYIWEDTGVDEARVQQIPPAVIHTLLENSITHCLPNDHNTMRFKLILASYENRQEYTFLTFGKIRKKEKNTTGGTGFKYIKARLTESYGNRWSFESEAVPEGWKNTITIAK